MRSCGVLATGDAAADVATSFAPFAARLCGRGSDRARQPLMGARREGK